VTDAPIDRDPLKDAKDAPDDGLLRAHQIMSEAPVVLAPDTPIFEAISTLSEHALTGAPICEEDGTMVGFLSELDCLETLVADAYLGVDPPNGGPTRAYMTDEPVGIDPDTSIFAVADLFRERALRVLPVLLDGRVVGRVTRHDVLEGIVRMRTEHLETLDEDDRRKPGLYLSATDHDAADVAARLD